jgi:ERCC4-related helicase
MENNTIVNMETGKGKTLIAIHLIDHFITKTPEKKVLFIVPSRALVSQQAAYVRNHSSLKDTLSPRVVEICGAEIDSWDLGTWSSIYRQHAVLVGTPEVFRKAIIDHGFMPKDIFSLVIFDEVCYKTILLSHNFRHNQLTVGCCMQS